METPSPSHQAAAPPPFPGNAPKKGLPPLAWFGIGCGGLIAVAVVIFGFLAVKIGTNVAKHLKEHPGNEAAEAVVAEYPDFEKIAENAERGEMTLRMKPSSRLITATYDDVTHGRVTIDDPAGNPVLLFQGDLAKVPAWVPRYPGATGETSVLHRDLPAQVHGIIVADSTDTIAAVEKYFDAEAAKLFTITSSSHSSSDLNGMRRLRWSHSGGKRKLEINAYSLPGSPLTIQTIYTEEK